MHIDPGPSGGAMVKKLDEQAYTSEFESHWVPPLYGFVPHLSKKLSELLQCISIQPACKE